MWQRIQTLYLAMACALASSLFFCRLSTIIGSDGAKAFVSYSDKTMYLILTIICVLLTLLSIFTYRLRLLQMRVAVLSSLVLLGFQGVLVYDYFANRSDMVFSFTAVFPAVAAILCMMASRRIFQDEIMVRASSRLRDTRRRRRRHNN